MTPSLQQAFSLLFAAKTCAATFSAACVIREGLTIVEFELLFPGELPPDELPPGLSLPPGELPPVDGLPPVLPTVLFEF